MSGIQLGAGISLGAGIGLGAGISPPPPGANTVIGYSEMDPPVVASEQLQDATATVNGSIGFTINNASQTGIAGCVIIEDDVTLWGQVGTTSGITIGTKANRRYFSPLTSRNIMNFTYAFTIFYVINLNHSAAFAITTTTNKPLTIGTKCK